MLNYEIEISEVFKEQLTLFFEYIAKENPNAALKWYDGLVENIFTLENSPQRCISL